MRYFIFNFLGFMALLSCSSLVAAEVEEATEADQAAEQEVDEFKFNGSLDVIEDTIRGPQLVYAGQEENGILINKLVIGTPDLLDKIEEGSEFRKYLTVERPYLPVQKILLSDENNNVLAELVTLKPNVNPKVDFYKKGTRVLLNTKKNRITFNIKEQIELHRNKIFMQIKDEIEKTGAHIKVKALSPNKELIAIHDSFNGVTIWNMKNGEKRFDLSSKPFTYSPSLENWDYRGCYLRNINIRQEDFIKNLGNFEIENISFIGKETVIFHTDYHKIEINIPH
jgi:hypothetical protein